MDCGHIDQIMVLFQIKKRIRMNLHQKYTLFMVTCTVTWPQSSKNMEKTSIFACLNFRNPIPFFVQKCYNITNHTKM